METFSFIYLLQNGFGGPGYVWQELKSWSTLLWQGNLLKTLGLMQIGDADPDLPNVPLISWVFSGGGSFYFRRAVLLCATKIVWSKDLSLVLPCSWWVLHCVSESFHPVLAQWLLSCLKRCSSSEEAKKWGLRYSSALIGNSRVRNSHI